MFCFLSAEASLGIAPGYEVAQHLKVAAAELTDPAVVRLLVAGHHPESKILVLGPFNLREENGPRRRRRALARSTATLMVIREPTAR